MPGEAYDKVGTNAQPSVSERQPVGASEIRISGCRRRTWCTPMKSSARLRGCDDRRTQANDPRHARKSGESGRVERRAYGMTSLPPRWSCNGETPLKPAPLNDKKVDVTVDVFARRCCRGEISACPGPRQRDCLGSELRDARRRDRQSATAVEGRMRCGKFSKTLAIWRMDLASRVNS